MASRGKVSRGRWFHLLGGLSLAYGPSPSPGPPRGEACFLWPRYHFLTQPVKAGKGVCAYMSLCWEKCPPGSLVCFCLFVLISFDSRGKSFSPFPLQQTYPHIFSARIQNHTHPKPVTVRGEMIAVTGLKYINSLKLGKRLSAPENINVQ